MTRRHRPGLSLTLRLAFLVFLIEIVLLGAFAIAVYLLSESRFYTSFDSVLRANAEAIGTLVEDDEGALELESAAEVVARHSRKARPDLFAVIRRDGSVLEKSRELARVPGLAGKALEQMVILDFEHRDRPYRGLLLPVVRDSPERPGHEIRVHVFFAASTRDLDAQLRDLAEILVWFTLNGLWISIVLAWIVAWKGLAPLRRLARDTAAIEEDSLDRRLDTTRLPREIAVLAESLNALLARIESAFERERRFSSDAAHELRTPVATLKSGIQAALLESPDAGRDRRALETLLEDVERLEDLCDALLLVASHQANGTEAEVDAEDWAIEIEEILRGLTANGAGADRAPQLRKPDPVPTGRKLRTNRAATRRIATNLIENALRHGGPTIRVEIAFPDTGARLAVEDDGPGVAPEDRPRLFERFFRADRARSRTTGGAGLGLAICQSLARASGGEIRYEPAAPQGSRFVWAVTGDRED